MFRGNKAEETELGEPSKMKQRGQAALKSLREHTPSREQLRSQAGAARDWAVEMTETHAVAVGVGALALGLVTAALLPVSNRERKVLASAAEGTRQLSRTLERTRELGPVSALARQLAALLPIGGEEQEAEPAPEPEQKKAAPVRARRTPATKKKASARRAPSTRRTSKAASARGGRKRTTSSAKESTIH